MIKRPSELFKESDATLAVAIREGNLPRIRQLVADGADVNAKKDRGFPIMRYSRKDEVLEVMLECSADIELRDEHGDTWLHLADTDEARMLLSHGADPNARDAEGETALFQAVRKESLPLAKLLIEHGADVNVQRSDGWTALHTAIIDKQFAIAQMLLDAGADVRLRDNQGDTALHFAVNMANVCDDDFVALLLRYGPDVNAASHEGLRYSAIHCASFWGMDKSICQLAEHGADLNARAGDGMTPVDIAIWQGRQSAARVLRSLGGRASNQSPTGDPKTA